MFKPTDINAFICTLGFVIGNCFAIGLWAVAMWRTGLHFFLLMFIVATVATVLSVVNMVIYYNPPVVIHILGPAKYTALFHIYIYAMVLNFAISLVGFGMIVRWICHACKQRTVQDPR